MPRATSPENMREVLSLRLRGYSNREVEERTGVKVRTVRNLVRSFKMRVKEDGLMEAASFHGVEPEVEELFGLASELRKDKIAVADCATGFYVAKVLVGLGVDIKEFEGFVRDIFIESVEQGLTG